MLAAIASLILMKNDCGYNNEERVGSSIFIYEELLRHTYVSTQRWGLPLSLILITRFIIG